LIYLLNVLLLLLVKQKKKNYNIHIQVFKVLCT